MQLDSAERMLVLRAGFLLTIVGATLRLLGFRRTAKIFRCGTLRPATDTSEETSRQTIRKVSRAVSLAARNSLRGPNCLRSSLVLNYLLRRRGYDSVLRIGVSSEGGKFEAHAWVELGQTVVNDTQDIARRFAPILDLSTATSIL